MRLRRIVLLMTVVLMIVALAPAVALADPSITPDEVEELVYPGESVFIDKTVGTPVIPPIVDICLVEDETGSFANDILNLQALAPQLVAALDASGSNYATCVIGYRDFEQNGWGSPGDWVYRRLADVGVGGAPLLAGVGLLSAAGGNDGPEAQLEALHYLATPGHAAIDSNGDGDTIDGNDTAAGLQPTWRAGSTRVALLATDASCHVTGDAGGWPGDAGTTSPAVTAGILSGQGITVIGLTPGGAGTIGCVDTLAAGTGGSVQATTSTGSAIVTAILAGLGNLPLDVSLTSDCEDPISTTFAPAVSTVTSGDDAFFTETIAVAAGAAGGTYTCSDEVMYDRVAADLFESKTINVPGITLEPVAADNELTALATHTVTATVAAGDAGLLEGVRVEFEIISGPNVGTTDFGLTDVLGELSFTWMPGGITPAFLGTDTVVASFTDADDTVVYGFDTATKTWIDTTPPIAACLESVNPHGNKKPSAPGNGGQGQNQDGFYELVGEDEVWPADTLEFFVVDSGSGTVFGPFDIGTVIKYTESDDAIPEIKPMGGPNSAVDWHIIGNGDAYVLAVDGSGNVSAPSYCLVPPPPK